MVRKTKKKAGTLILVTLLLMLVISGLGYKSLILLGNHNFYDKYYLDKTSPNSSFMTKSDSSSDRITSIFPSKAQPDPSVSLTLDKLNSPNAILILLKDYSILMQKNSEEKIYPASLSKMMTAIAAIENLSDLKEEVKLSNTTFQWLYEKDASMAGFQPGESVRAIDLLYGIMLPSGAECCIGLADHIAGSEQSFVKIMNQKAVDLGMDSTHFENTTGLHSKNHYTTVNDLAILLSYALQNDTFRKIFTSSSYSTPPTNKHPDGITFHSTMFEKLNNQSIINGKILGGKTGYTKEAGLCLASLAKIGKQEYILISAGAKGDHYSEQYNITDAISVYSSIGKK